MSTEALPRATLSLHEVAERMGATYRQVWSWADRGFLPVVEHRPGTGGRYQVDAERFERWLANETVLIPRAAAQIRKVAGPQNARKRRRHGRQQVLVSSP